MYNIENCFLNVQNLGKANLTTQPITQLQIVVVKYILRGTLLTQHEHKAFSLSHVINVLFLLDHNRNCINHKVILMVKTNLKTSQEYVVIHLHFFYLGLNENDNNSIIMKTMKSIFGGGYIWIQRFMISHVVCGKVV